MKTTLPVLILKDFLLFPYQEVKLKLKNNLTKRIIELSQKKYNSEILIVAPKDSLEESPVVSDLPTIGVIGKIKKAILLPDGQIHIFIEGEKRVAVSLYENKTATDILFASFTPLEIPKISLVEEESKKRKLLELLKTYVQKSPKVSNSFLNLLKPTDTLGEITDKIIPNLQITSIEKIAYIETMNPVYRAQHLLEYLAIEIEVIHLEEKLDASLQDRITQKEKEYILQEKKEEIERELGFENAKEKEVEEYLEKIRKNHLPGNIEIKLRKEIEKLEKTNESSPEISFIRNYIENMLALPWNKNKQGNTNLESVRKSLEKEHYGLEKIKDRILEYVAIKKKNPEIKSPILCLIGPPGVGKTTIAKSISEALELDFAKLSVGGLTDSAELLGHRRTYIASSPGKIITSLQKCSSKNPVFLIDEIDKMGKDYQNNPINALLEILDPALNNNFTDLYLEEPFDLSKVFFILTANYIDRIPEPLLDRLEIIQLESYTIKEKVNIAKNYLLPNIKKEYALEKKACKVSEAVLKSLIANYTKEAGVRELKRLLETMIRKQILNGKEGSISFDDVKTNLGLPKFTKEFLKPNIGLVNALAVSNAGGMILQVESLKYTGTGKLIITGNVEKTMQESIIVITSYLKTLIKEDINKNDYHIHFHASSIKKDGPSAGLAIAMSLWSLLLKKVIPKEYAFTGEVSLHGEIIPIGALKEKLIACANAKINTVIIPKKNHTDLLEVPQEVVSALNIIEVEHIKEVFALF